MNSWGFLYYFSLSMCSELCRCEPPLVISAVPVFVCVCAQPSHFKTNSFSCLLQGDQGDQGPRVCGLLRLLVISWWMWLCVSPPAELWAKRFEMHEIPGIVFFPSGQTQQASQRCLFLHQERAGYLWKARRGALVETQRPLVFKLNMSAHFSAPAARYLLNLSHNQKPTSSVSIITRDSLQSSTWHGVFRALIISSSVVWHFYKSAAPKWWWCECFSVLDRLWNELLYLHLAASAPSFFSNNG